MSIDIKSYLYVRFRLNTNIISRFLNISALLDIAFYKKFLFVKLIFNWNEISLNMHVVPTARIFEVVNFLINIQLLHLF